MLDTFYDLVDGMEPHIALLLVSMVPLIELRGGIILGAMLGLAWESVLLICIIGNVIPVPFIILFGRFMLDQMEKTRLFGNLVKRYKRKVMSKSEIITKYGPWGLMLFVGVPLPGTGAWTGSVLALLMNLRMKSAVPAILMGVVIAGILMTLGSQGVLNVFRGMMP